MPDGSEFHTVGAATLKPWEAKVVRTRGMDSRSVFAERRERVGLSTLHGLSVCFRCRTGLVTSVFVSRRT